MALLDFLIIGAPKAGSTALHEALAPHPQLFLSNPKEPKFFLCDGTPPDPAGQRGPGDPHSAQEWIWRRDQYEALFDAAPAGTLKGESTPFYLWDKASHLRIKALLPDVKLIAVVRDPIDRAYSNWAHLWCDGLEPESDFVAACQQEPARIAAGYAPFWRYLETGKYGEQLEHLYSVFDRSQVFVMRYRQLVSEPQAVLDRICAFLGIEQGVVSVAKPSNVKYWVPKSPVNQVLRRVVRSGAWLGSKVPPQHWRAVEKRLLTVLHRGGGQRPKLSVADRKALLPYFEADTALLESVTGESFADWRRETGRGAFVDRLKSAEASTGWFAAVDAERGRTSS